LHKSEASISSSGLKPSSNPLIDPYSKIETIIDEKKEMVAIAAIE
jgi:hypothetical protein